VISKETAFYQRKLLEFYPDDRTFEDEQDLIEMRVGSLPDEGEPIPVTETFDDDSDQYRAN